LDLELSRSRRADRRRTVRRHRALDAATAALAFTAVTTVLAVGQLLGPLAAGVVADHAGLGAVPVFAAAVFACGALRSGGRDVRERV
jgi:predicted MFS family arabinose efflux permease